jgi:putative oxidoreductase
MEHGYAKLARGPDDFANILHALGMPFPTLLAWATVGVEIVGGLAVFLGAYIPVVSLPMAAVLLVAIFTVHLPNGFSSIKLQSVTAAGAHFGQPGYETDLLYLAGLASLLFGGSGPLALNNLFSRRGDDRDTALKQDQDIRDRTENDTSSGRMATVETIGHNDARYRTNDHGRRQDRLLQAVLS